MLLFDSNANESLSGVIYLIRHGIWALFLFELSPDLFYTFLLFVDSF